MDSNQRKFLILNLVKILKTQVILIIFLEW